jgi:D-alanyl-D-alanine carboxypeptidase
MYRFAWVQLVRPLVLFTVPALLFTGQLVAGAAAPTASPAAPALQAAIDQLVKDGIPGVIALTRDGRSESHATSGVANLATGAGVNPGDRFRIGSVTKSFTSTVVLQLVGDGRLSLDDSVEKLLPGLVPNGGNITVRELLNHTSGLFDYADDGDPTVAINPYFVQRDWDYVWQPRQLVAVAVSHSPNFAPGTAWRYSNTGYILLGLIVEAVTHRNLKDEIESRIIEPLDLESTSFPITDPDIDGPHTHGYYTNIPPEYGLGTTFDLTTFSPSWAWAAGGIVSTVNDVARFYRALLEGRLLRPTQLQQMETTVPTPLGVDYGLGVFRIDTPCGPAWGHDGDFPGYLTISLTTPDGARQVVLLLNSDQFLSLQTLIDRGNAVLVGLCGAGGSTASAIRIATATR